MRAKKLTGMHNKKTEEMHSKEGGKKRGEKSERRMREIREETKNTAGSNEGKKQ
jgi:hypothetical protein